MKRLFLTLAAVLTAALTSYAEETTSIRTYGDITRIDASFLYELHISEGRSGEVKLVYDSAYEKHISARYDKEESSLTLELDDIPKKFKIGNQPAIHVYLEMDHIDEVILSGAGKACFQGKFTARELHIGMSGAAQISGLDIEGNSLKLNCSGACKAEMSGCFKDEMDIDISGACKCDFNMTARELDGEFSGACLMKNNGDIQLCDIECSGASKIILTGNGKELSAEGSGACSIDTKKFNVMNAVIGLSGAGKAQIYAEKTLTYNVSRASKLVHYGNAELIDKTEAYNVVKGD